MKLLQSVKTLGSQFLGVLPELGVGSSASGSGEAMSMSDVSISLKYLQLSNNNYYDTYVCMYTENFLYVYLTYSSEENPSPKNLVLVSPFLSPSPFVSSPLLRDLRSMSFFLYISLVVAVRF